MKTHPQEEMQTTCAIMLMFCSWFYVMTTVQGWVFAMAKSIFARTVEKTGKNRGKKPAKTATYKIVQKHPNWGN